MSRQIGSCDVPGPRVAGYQHRETRDNRHMTCVILLLNLPTKTTLSTNNQVGRYLTEINLLTFHYNKIINLKARFLCVFYVLPECLYVWY